MAEERNMNKFDKEKVEKSKGGNDFDYEGYFFKDIFTNIDSFKNLYEGLTLNELAGEIEYFDTSSIKPCDHLGTDIVYLRNNTDLIVISKLPEESENYLKHKTEIFAEKLTLLYLSNIGKLDAYNSGAHIKLPVIEMIGIANRRPGQVLE